MRNLNRLAKISGLSGLIAASVASPSLAGGHRGSAQPVYLVPAAPVAYAPVAAYGPAPLAYAPAKHLHKSHLQAYAPVGYPYGAAPAAAYAPVGYPYGAAPAPAYYSLQPYTAQAPAAAPPAGAAPGAAVYQWQYVKVGTTPGGSVAGSAAPAVAGAAAPTNDSSLPSLAGLNGDQNDKIRKLLRDHLDKLVGTSLNGDQKLSDMDEWAKDIYARELGKSSSTELSGDQQSQAHALAQAIGGSPSTATSQPGGTATNNTATNSGANAPQGIMVPAYAPFAYYPQLFLPVAPSGGLFHHKYK